MPTRAEVAAGALVTTGGAATDRVAAVVVAVPEALVKTARNCVPSSARAAVAEYDDEVAPAMSVQVVPPSVECCHCTVGSGTPDAAAAREKGPTPGRARLAGDAVTTGAAAAELTETTAVQRSKDVPNWPRVGLPPPGLSPVAFELSPQTGSKRPPKKARPV